MIFLSKLFIPCGKNWLQGTESHRRSSAYETDEILLLHPATVIYRWSIGLDLNQRINGFAIRAIGPLWYRCISLIGSWSIDNCVQPPSNALYPTSVALANRFGQSPYGDDHRTSCQIAVAFCCAQTADDSL